jgi:hypothetical protein
MACLPVFPGGAVFTAVTGLIWPVHYPAWAQRTASGTFLAGLPVLGGSAFWLLRRQK